MRRFRSLALLFAMTCLLPPLAGGEPPQSETQPGDPFTILVGKELFSKDSGHDFPVTGLAFSPDGKTLVSAWNYGPTVIWNTASRQRSATLQEGFRIFSFSPDGKQLVTVAVNSGKVRIWDLTAAKEAKVIAIADALEVSSAMFSPDGRTLFTLEWNSQQQKRFCVRHWDLATGTQDRMWSIPNEIYPISLVPDGKRLIVTLKDGSIGSYDAESGREQYLGRHKAWGWLKLSPDARMVASWKNTPNSPIGLWELTTGQEIFALTGHECAVSVIAWSADGGLVASGDECNKLQVPTSTRSVELWSAATGKKLRHYAGLKADVTALAFAPDGASLVAGLRDGTIWTWGLDHRFAPTPKRGRDELESYWADLAAADAAKAHQALGELVATAKISVPFMKACLEPAREPDLGKIERLIANMSNEKFAVRQAAAKELEKADVQVVGYLREALKGKLPLEASVRLKKILNNLSESPAPNSLRTIRAIMALERIGSTDAQAILQTLARGARGARETEEARASVERLGRRTSKVP